MDRMTKKRLLGFEQLDARIAMNADMRPFFEMDYDAMPVRMHEATQVRLQNVVLAHTTETGSDYRTAQVLVIGVAQMPTSHPALGPQFMRDGHGMPKMKLPPDRPEGEQKGINKTDSVAQTIQSASVGIDSPKVAITFFVSGSLPGNSLPTGKPFVPSGIFSRSVAAPTTPVENPSLGNSSNNTLEIPTQSLRRESSVAAKPVQSTPTPISSPLYSESTPTPSDSRSGFQYANAPTESLKSIATIVNPKEPSSTVSHLASTKRLESMKPTNNGMFEFSLRSPNDQAKAERNRSGSFMGNASMSSNDLAIMAEIDRLNLGWNSNHRKLPAPKGMIEIGDIAEVTRQPAIVYRASNNPFEIMQLVLGSNNSASTRETSDRIDEENSSMSSDLATREESIFALTIGALFALAIRQKRKTKSPFHFVSVSR